MTIKNECKENYKKFCRFVKGKRVIVVGPSANLMNYEKGSYIDSFDVIVRLNSSFPLFGDIRKHFGSRTDVVYYVSGGINEHFANIKKMHGIDVLKHDKIKFIIFKKGFNCHSTKYKRKFNTFFNSYHLAVKMFPMKKITMYLKSKLKNDPNMGTLAMEHLLNTDLKELHVIGCDFYKYPHYPKYSVLPTLKFDYNKRILINEKTGWKQKTRHDISKQLEYLKTLMAKNKNLILEDDLKNMILENTLKINPNRKYNVLIPKIIHIVWIGSKLPHRYKYNIHTFRKLNPDWEVRFWSDKQINKERFVNQDLIDIMPTFAAKVDIIRLEILYKYGGIYTDCDSVCFKPLDAMVSDKKIFGMHHKANVVANGTLGGTKGHQAFKKLVFGLKSHIQKFKKQSVNTLSVAGQYYITPVLIKNRDFVLIDKNLDKGKRQLICSIYEADLSNCYIYHDLARSWHYKKNITL